MRRVNVMIGFLPDMLTRLVSRPIARRLSERVVWLDTFVETMSVSFVSFTTGRRIQKLFLACSRRLCPDCPD